MTAVWPPELPQRPLRDPYRRSLASGRQLTSPDSGPPRGRRRYSRVARPVSMAFVVTLNQLARFRRFHDEDLDAGTLPFWFRDPVMSGVPMLTTDGVPLLVGGVPLVTTAWWLCMLDQEPPSEAALGGGRFQLSVPMLVMP